MSTVAFEWDNPNQLLAQVRELLDARNQSIRRVPEAAVRRGTFELLKLVQDKAPKKTSTLVRSIQAVVEKISDDIVVGRVGTWLEYARYLEEGTGIFGPMKRPIPVMAKQKGGLYWGAADSNGKPIIRKRVLVQGIKPRGYFAAAVAEFLPRYLEIIQEELAKA